MNTFGTGCYPSKKDRRHIKHSNLVCAGEPLIKGGYNYQPNEIENQHTVGICTAISMVQNREKANGKHYSPEMQYLLQKKFYDNNWMEGSSVFNALQVAKKYGFLPSELWTYTNETDRQLPYAQYIQKIEKIGEMEIQRLIGLCGDKIPGYASVDVSDPQAMARAIVESEAGILCRIEAGPTWWSSATGITSWQPKDIDPLRKPTTNLSGHAINIQNFDYTFTQMQQIANSWGTQWDLQGCANINWNNYRPTEAWIILKQNPMFKFNFDMKLGSRLKPDVKELQLRLNMPILLQTGYFGPITKKYVMDYQKKHNLKSDGFCGIFTRQELNK